MKIINMTIKENIAYLKHFGLKVSFWKNLNAIVKGHFKGKIAWKIHNINNDIIENYISSKCSNTIKSALSENFKDDMTNITKIQENKFKQVKENNTIWMMWWQGEKNAPPIVRACIDSIRKNCKGHPVIIIDESNYKNYVAIPEIVLKRYEEGKKDNTYLKDTVLTTTHFSDIIRTLLLYNYGGVWIDATIFLTDSIPNRYFTDEFTTLGEDNKWFIGEGKWSSWFMGCLAGNLLMKFIYQMHIEYLINEKYYVNYLMIYSIIDIGYKKISKFKNMIDLTESGNNKALTINRIYNEEADEKFLKEFLEEQHIHKLSWKWWGNDINAPLYIKTQDNKLTYFGYIYTKYIQ